jgi:hypothetical protein
VQMMAADMKQTVVNAIELLGALFSFCVLLVGLMMVVAALVVAASCLVTGECRLLPGATLLQPTIVFVGGLVLSMVGACGVFWVLR